MREIIAECESAGHSHGLAAGLALALAGVDTDAAPGPFAALPATAVPAGTAVLTHPMAAKEGISFVRTRRRDVPAELRSDIAARLGAARLGTTQRLYERAVEHLSARTSGGEAIVRKQLVQGTLADTYVALEVARRGLRIGGKAALTDLHDRLTALDWELAKLLGASGYAGEHAVASAFVSRLAANCWVPRDGAP